MSDLRDRLGEVIDAIWRLVPDSMPELAVALEDEVRASWPETPVGPVRIRSANCRLGDHDECLGMVEQDVPELGITDCLCKCHPFPAHARHDEVVERLDRPGNRANGRLDAALRGDTDA